MIEAKSLQKRAYYEENKEKIKNRQLKYYYNNRQAILERHKDKNKEKSPKSPFDQETEKNIMEILSRREGAISVKTLRTFYRRTYKKPLKVSGQGFSRWLAQNDRIVKVELSHNKHHVKYGYYIDQSTVEVLQ